MTRQQFLLISQQFYRGGHLRINLLVSLKQKVDRSFDDNGGDDEADIGFEVDVPYEIDDGREEDGTGNDGIVESFDAAGFQGGGAGGLAGVAQIEAEGDFGQDADDEDDDGGDGDV